MHSRLFEVLARAGFVSRGLVYGIIGVLAFRLAVGAGGKITNQQGALHTVAHQPFGKFALTLVAIGLGGYSMWRLFRALIGHGPEGSDHGIDRLGAAASGLFYGLMCFAAVKILMGSAAGSTGNAKKTTIGVLGWPGGRWIVGIAGAVMIGVALYQGYRGITKKFLQDSKTEQMSPSMRRWITRVGTVGHLARMVVFGLVGIFLIKAATDDERAFGGRARRRARQAPSPCLWQVHARRRGGRPGRVRPVFAERRALPQDLSHFTEELRRASARPMLGALEQPLFEGAPRRSVVGDGSSSNLDPDLLDDPLRASADLMALLADYRHRVDRIKQPLGQPVDLGMCRSASGDDAEVDHDLDPEGLFRGNERHARASPCVISFARHRTRACLKAAARVGQHGRHHHAPRRRPPTPPSKSEMTQRSAATTAIRNSQ